MAWIVHDERDRSSVWAISAESYNFGVGWAGTICGELDLAARAHQAAIDSEREWRGGGTDCRGFEIAMSRDDHRRYFLRQRALPPQVTAFSRFRVGARSREDVEGRRGVSVRRANEDGIGRDTGSRGGAFADVISDPSAECE